MTAVTEDAFGKEDIATEVLQELQSELAKVSSFYCSIMIQKEEYK